ncbi:MAG: hypothetical protein ABJG78_09005 [Cyclobacteriaceae bacterium]
MRVILLVIVLTALSSCYKNLELEGFNEDDWKSFRTTCSEYRLKKADLLIENQDLLLESTQNEIESLLGAAEEHELYRRNEKFFHYRLTPRDTCENADDTIKFLSIRFNAVGRASDVQVMLRDQ